MTTVVNIKSDQHYDYYIGRPSIWGNPFVIGRDGNRTGVLHLYEMHLTDLMDRGVITIDDLRQLRGKKLGCFCAPAPCHGDIIVRFIEKYVK